MQVVQRFQVPNKARVQASPHSSLLSLQELLSPGSLPPAHRHPLKPVATPLGGPQQVHPHLALLARRHRLLVKQAPVQAPQVQPQGQVALVAALAVLPASRRLMARQLVE